MKIHLRTFAILRERAGAAEAELDLAEGATVATAMDEAARRFPGIAALLPRAAVAVNRAYADRSAVLREGDELALIPPVSGGKI